MYYKDTLDADTPENQRNKRFVLVDSSRPAAFEQQINLLISDKTIQLRIEGFSRTYEYISAIVYTEEVR